jgi:hypothetical protein
MQAQRSWVAGRTRPQQSDCSAARGGDSRSAKDAGPAETVVALLGEEVSRCFTSLDPPAAWCVPRVCSCHRRVTTAQSVILPDARTRPTRDGSHRGPEFLLSAHPSPPAEREGSPATRHTGSVATPTLAPSDGGPQGPHRLAHDAATQYPARRRRALARVVAPQPRQASVHVGADHVLLDGQSRAATPLAPAGPRRGRASCRAGGRGGQRIRGQSVFDEAATAVLVANDVQVSAEEGIVSHIRQSPSAVPAPSLPSVSSPRRRPSGADPHTRSMVPPPVRTLPRPLGRRASSGRQAPPRIPGSTRTAAREIAGPPRVAPGRKQARPAAMGTAELDGSPQERAPRMDGRSTANTSRTRFPACPSASWRGAPAGIHIARTEPGRRRRQTPRGAASGMRVTPPCRRTRLAEIPVGAVAVSGRPSARH